MFGRLIALAFVNSYHSFHQHLCLEGERKSKALNASFLLILAAAERYSEEDLLNLIASSPSLEQATGEEQVVTPLQ